MGAYLSTPMTSKSSEDHFNQLMKCGASSMQGWRVSQEDAHNCCLDLTETVSLFGVYDGHGGKEVAIYAHEHFPDELKNNEKFKAGLYAEALKESFISFDKKLIEPDVVEELKKIAETDDNPVNVSEAEEEEDDNIGDLREEAAMPLAQVMAKYRNKLTDASPASPFLRAKGSRGESSGSGCSSKAEYATSSSSKTEDAAGASSSQTNDKTENISSSADVASSTSEVDVTSSCSTADVAGPSSPPDSTFKSKSPRKSLAEKYSNGEVTPAEAKEEIKQQENTLDSTTDAVKVNGDGINAVPKKSKSDVSSSSDVDSNEAERKTPSDNVDSSDDDESDEDFSGIEDEGGVLRKGLDSDDSDEEDDLEEEEEEDSSEGDEDEDDDDLYGDDGIGIPLSGMREVPGEDSGCTAVVALVFADKVIVANAGDSRCVASRSGQAVDLSFDHKPEDPEELQRITKAGGKVTGDGRVNGGLNLSRALGDHTYKKVQSLPLEDQMISPMPDIQELTITPDIEFLVLACDGIWNYMSSQEVIDYVRPRLQKKPEKLSSICEELFDECLAPHTGCDGTGCDNMTAIIVQFRPDQDLADIPSTDSADNSTSTETATEVISAVSAIADSAKRRADDGTEDGAAAKRTKTDEHEDGTSSTNE